MGGISTNIIRLVIYFAIITQNTRGHTLLEDEEHEHLNVVGLPETVLAILCLTSTCRVATVPYLDTLLLLPASSTERPPMGTGVMAGMGCLSHVSDRVLN